MIGNYVEKHMLLISSSVCFFRSEARTLSRTLRPLSMTAVRRIGGETGGMPCSKRGCRPMRGREPYLLSVTAGRRIGSETGVMSC
jgi:hypothetical protein